MILPPYLNSFYQYPDFKQLKRCAELAENAFCSEVVNKDPLNELRGNLLRILDEISQVQANPHSIYSMLSNYALSFFNFHKIKGNLKDISNQELQDIKNTLIVALRGLANDFPIHDVDPIDLTPIDNDEVCFTSLTGRRYRLVNLVNWIKIRKAFIYPDTNSVMLVHDIEPLKRLCAQQNLSLEPKPSHIIELEQELLNTGFSVNHIEELKVSNLRKNHILVLKMLVTEYQLSHSKAIAELKGLNYEHADALNALYSRGLRGDHLRNLSIDEEEFGPHHTVVLMMLMDDWHYDVEAAVRCISGCDFEEIQKFYSIPAPTS
ncbi:Uncharacterised protein [Legionella sainthelensi]|uniref:hypothetical protein n=1 Tax=Legionella sainthelensi TaxID=28087 RepID=UPI000F71BB1D|nr:hypothetical protein [Legionella sainthelensi]VEB36452.1 Uncharacterised protein [Legionella sainthelensi]